MTKAVDALFGRVEHVDVRLGRIDLAFRVRSKTPGVMTLEIASPHLLMHVGMQVENLRALLDAGADLLAAPRPTGFLVRLNARRPVATSLTQLTTDLAVDLRRYGPESAERVTVTFQSTPGPTFAAFDLPASDFEVFMEHGWAAEALADVSLTEHGRSLIADMKESAAALKWHAKRYAASQNN